MEPEIRKLTTTDWRAYKIIRLESLQLHPDRFGSSFEREAVFTDLDFEQRIQSTNIFAAFDDGIIIAIASFAISALQKLRHKGTVHEVYVKKGFRAKGIGAALLKTLIEDARGRVELLQCTVTTDNREALKLYSKHGFKLFGTEKKALKVNDTYFDEYHLALDMSELPGLALRST